MKIARKRSTSTVVKLFAIGIVCCFSTCLGYRFEKDGPNFAPPDLSEVIPARYSHPKYRRLSGPGTYSCRTRGKFQDMTSYNSYWSCDSTPDGGLVATRRSCPLGFVFNPELHECIEKTSKRCGSDCEDKNEECSTTSTCPTTCSTKPRPPCFKCTCEGVFPDPNSCTSFYICHKKKGCKAQFEKIKVNCPEGMAFDSKAGWCSQTAKGSEFKKSAEDEAS